LLAAAGAAPQIKVVESVKVHRKSDNYHRALSAELERRRKTVARMAACFRSRNTVHENWAV
jgi:hypothetical protein